MLYIIFHSVDLDGHLSGAIIRWYYEQQGLKNEIDFKMIGMDYGQVWDENQIQDGDTVIMADVTLQPYERLINLNKRCDLFVFDHHKTVAPILEANNIKGMYGDDSIAACEVCWVYFMGAKKVPDFVKLLSAWDAWNDQDKEYWDKEVKPFQMGMRMLITDPSDVVGWFVWQEWIKNVGSPITMCEMIDNMKQKGTTVIQYQNEMNKDLMKRSFDMEFEGLRFIVVNGYKGSPQFDSKWDDTKYDAMMSFYNMENKYWSVSLYTSKDIDLSVIAKKWNGGGHAKACGFQVQNIKDVIGGKD